MLELCQNPLPPDDLNCDAMLTVGRTTCYYAWTTIILPYTADGSAICHLACPFCDQITQAPRPAENPRGIYESTKNHYQWVGYPALPSEMLEGEVPAPDGPDYECRVRCPNCGRQPEFIGRFDPIWASHITWHDEEAE